MMEGNDEGLGVFTWTSLEELREDEAELQSYAFIKQAGR